MDDWLTTIPDTLTYEDSPGSTKPLREHPFVRESPDLGHFLLKSLNTQKEVGARVPVKKLETPEAVQAWRKEHMGKFHSAGLIEGPPEKPEGYEIKKPDKLVDGVTWSDERAGKFAGVLHKHGIPKSAVQDLLDMHVEALTGAHAAFQTDKDNGVIALKREFGDKYDERMEQAKRLTKVIFKDEKELAFLAETGIANHPGFLGVVMRLAPLAMQDSSLMPKGDDGGAGAITGDTVRAEVADIMSNPQNPRYAGYHRKEKAVMDYIDQQYQKAYGTGKVTI